MRDIKLWLDFGVLLTVGWIICAVMGLVQPANAADLLIGQRTHHFTPTSNWDRCKSGEYYCREEFNDSQELIGISVDKWAILYMHQNSVREKSVVVTRAFKIDAGKYIRTFAAIGAATGYNDFYPRQSIGDITPMGYFGVDIHPSSDNFGLLITWQPQGFVGAGLRFKIN